MRVLLTGAGGFVGHHTLEHFLKNTDWHIVLTDSFNHMGTSARIREVLEANPGYEDRVEIITHDLTTPIDPVTAAKFGDIRVIFSMASESHVDRSLVEPRTFIQNNVALATTMLEYARTLPNLVAFIQVSTDEIYGPAAEGYSHKEWDPVIPSNPYSASKAAQEAIAISYWRSYNVPVIITNTMNIIGERQNVEKFVPMVIRALSRGGAPTIHAQSTPDGWKAGSRHYLHARNQADAIMFLANKALEGEPLKYSAGVKMPLRINVAGESEIKNDDMAFMIADILGVKANISYIDFHSTRPGHDSRYSLDPSKLAELGWKAPVSLQESLKKTVEWTMQHPEWLE